MIPELGQFALVLAVGLCLIQGVLPLWGAAVRNADWVAVARPAAAGQFVFVAIAFAILMQAFLSNDFSVAYVARNSNTALPTMYKVAAVWGAHEGSLLLWSLVLAGWTVAVAVGSRGLPEIFAARVLGVLGLISAGILLFTVATSNPFERLPVPPLDGNDLNPLLQDPALAIHPPMLYIGYVGFAVAFAFAVAALLAGRLDREWARWTRPWTTWAWMFLTMGIALGSWWAYYELGWGGWWFWDPVENASFMPWLLGTALIHSLAVTEKRGLFKSWTLLLAIGTFSLSLLGTFLVRSGVLVSVHAFAADPARGVFILMLLGSITGTALVLYAVRARNMVAEGGFHAVSREVALLLNNVFLVGATAAVLFGTLYPLFLDALGAGKISVGPPFFEIVFLIPMLPLLFLLGLGMHTAWRTMQATTLLRMVRIPALVAVLVGLIVPWLWFDRLSVLSAVGIVSGCWVVAASLRDPIALWRSQRRLPRGQWGMIVAHCGLGLFVLGVTVTSAYNIEIDESIRPGESLEIGSYELGFRGLRNVEGPNYRAVEGEFELRRDGTLVTVLAPQKRVYNVQTSPMTEASIDSAWSRDVFVALGDSLGDGAWSVRLQYKPMIRFIWFGALVMALGGLLATTDRRYRNATAPKPSPATDTLEDAA